jgi:hypothetical protein
MLRNGKTGMKEMGRAAFEEFHRSTVFVNYFNEIQGSSPTYAKQK